MDDSDHEEKWTDLLFRRYTTSERSDGVDRWGGGGGVVGKMPRITTRLLSWTT